jgi:Xaa-Pro aminopeptidase
MDAVAAMQDAMIGAVRPGLSLRDAYAAAMRAAAPWSGDDPTFIFQLHGIGLETHEPPRFCSPNEPYFPLPDAGAPDDVPIDPQAVVCLELGIGGIWTEDLFRLTTDGAERLTTLPRAILAPIR